MENQDHMDLPMKIKLSGTENFRQESCRRVN